MTRQPTADGAGSRRDLISRDLITGSRQRARGQPVHLRAEEVGVAALDELAEGDVEERLLDEEPGAEQA